jgi:hypothetical protein
VSFQRKTALKIFLVGRAAKKNLYFTISSINNKTPSLSLYLNNSKKFLPNIPETE